MTSTILEDLRRITKLTPSFEEIQALERTLARQPLHLPVPPSSVLFLLLFALTCLLVTVASLAFAFSARAGTARRHQPSPAATSVAFRCGHAEDSLRSFLASSRNYTAGERENVLTVVGIHTEIGSAARRAALRATWFSPNPGEVGEAAESAGGRGGGRRRWA
ncbi:hypothetical protein GUJ93_ZPchr0008g14075 [Zizania palustris]|uniref:Hexosyltransferase n=1 Tax=Zizania palustris TaxID=103762 RepID=A0A8J5V261_ZIZPA|nr:hypothetical protein GUJ93_ZPchr0008g14075 [Zizania palustris]